MTSQCSWKLTPRVRFSSEEALAHLLTVQRRPRQTSEAPNTAGSLQVSEQAREILSALQNQLLGAVET
jgi:hypothetical protein